MVLPPAFKVMLVLTMAQSLNVAVWSKRRGGHLDSVHVEINCVHVRAGDGVARFQTIRAGLAGVDGIPHASGGAGAELHIALTAIISAPACPKPLVTTLATLL